MNDYAKMFRRFEDPDNVRRLLLIVRSRAQSGEAEAVAYCRAMSAAGCPSDLGEAVKWHMQGNRGENAFSLMNSSNPEDVGRGIMMLDRMAREGDPEAIKVFKAFHVLGCPTDLDGAVRWHLQGKRAAASRQAGQPAASGGCMLIVCILIPVALFVSLVG